MGERLVWRDAYLANQSTAPALPQYRPFVCPEICLNSDFLSTSKFGSFHDAKLSLQKLLWVEAVVQFPDMSPHCPRP